MEYNKLYNEDCLKTMSRMPNDFVDLTVTSPPYDNLRKYNGYCFDFENVAKELYRVTKKGGVVVWVVGDKTNKGTESGTSFKQALFFKKCGFNLHDTMIYKKNNIRPLTHNRYEQEFEFMFVFSKGKPRVFNPIKKDCVKQPKKDTFLVRNADSIENRTIQRKKERIIGNVWKYNTGMNLSTKDKIAFNHPAIFPEQLANDHIISWSNENDIVYDPFAGSGTTPKMADRNNRKWVASEISKEYCQIIEQRLSPNNFEKVEAGGLFSFTDNPTKAD